MNRWPTCVWVTRTRQTGTWQSSFWLGEQLLADAEQQRHASADDADGEQAVGL
jgi:hypothetical protein